MSNEIKPGTIIEDPVTGIRKKCVAVNTHSNHDAVSYDDKYTEYIWKKLPFSSYEGTGGGSANEITIVCDDTNKTAEVRDSSGKVVVAIGDILTFKSQYPNSKIPQAPFNTVFPLLIVPKALESGDIEEMIFYNSMDGITHLIFGYITTNNTVTHGMYTSEEVAAKIEQETGTQTLAGWHSDDGTKLDTLQIVATYELIKSFKNLAWLFEGFDEKAVVV